MIKNPNDIVEALVSDYLKIFGTELLSAVMYGSAVSHEYRPGKSDINIAMIVADNSIKRLSPSIAIQKKWEGRGVSIPLFLTKSYIERSLDTFPIEFLDIQTCYRVLYGEDLLGGLKIERNNLRLQCERELKGLTLRLRSSYTHAQGHNGRLAVLLDAAMRKLIPNFKAILVLNNRKIPSGKSEIIAAVEDVYGLGASVFSEVFNNVKHSRVREGDIFDRFTNQVDSLIEFIDTLKVQGGVS